jgi:hypothetical protein
LKEQIDEIVEKAYEHAKEHDGTLKIGVIELGMVD